MSHTPELKGSLTAFDFNGAVMLRFDDGSFAFFDYAFASEEGDEKQYLVVYTEHCGYHVFHRASLDDWREFHSQAQR